ncbi:bifunctional DNA primase/polymerase [Streptomyces albidoflavus]|uniref:bifunctional DNA primase/polymerase n=1 Tax=Streptomyces albidoflavus TaxID=1886 RepID=UPI0033FE1167
MTTRDIQAVIEASDYQRHGTLTGSFLSRAACICPKTPCGGVASDTEDTNCPEHQLNPAQHWHWAAECTPLTPVVAARGLVRRGLAVFPLPAAGRVPERGWQRQATRVPELLPELLTDGANIGVGCRASRVVALDLDVHGDHDGPGVLAALAERLGQVVPETFTVATPSGGQHLYFRAPEGCTIGSVSGGRTPLGPGIDVCGPGRRHGGYLIGPGSVVAGRSYVIARDLPVAPLPHWIGALLARREAERPAQMPRTWFTVEGFTRDPVKEGACNCVCRMYHFYTDGRCDGGAVREAEVTWVSAVTGEPAEPRVEPLCSPCYEAVVVRLGRQARYT